MSNVCSMRPARRVTKERGAEVADALEGLRSAARRWSHDWASAEDLLQDAALKAVAAIDSFQPGSSATAWLRTIMYRLAVDETRRYRRERVVRRSYAALAPESTEPVTPDEATPPPSYDLVDVREAAQQLPRALRDTFWMWAVEGMTYHQISERQGIPVGTVGTRLLRARQAIRDRLQSTRRGPERAHHPGLTCEPRVAAGG
jgi:RNA polymerase sigma-70 factor (ECF subfamily)